MKSRLEDLLATADRQLASRAFDAAIDTYRTALGEPGADEAGVPGKLDAACRARDAARGIVRPAEPTPEIAAAPPIEIAAPPPEPPEETAPVEPPQKRAPAFRTIVPPSFHLMEDDPAMLERPGRVAEAEVEVEPLSILNPTPPPEQHDGLDAVRLLVTVLIIVAVCGAIFLGSHC